MTSEILAACQSRPEKITLRSMCVLSKNTEFFADKPRPILYGIAVEVHGGYCFPAKFMYKVLENFSFIFLKPNCRDPKSHCEQRDCFAGRPTRWTFTIVICTSSQLAHSTINLGPKSKRFFYSLVSERLKYLKYFFRRLDPATLVNITRSRKGRLCAYDERGVKMHSNPLATVKDQVHWRASITLWAQAGRVLGVET